MSYESGLLEQYWAWKEHSDDVADPDDPGYWNVGVTRDALGSITSDWSLFNGEFVDAFLDSWFSAYGPPATDSVTTLSPKARHRLLTSKLGPNDGLTYTARLEPQGDAWLDEVADAVLPETIVDADGFPYETTLDGLIKDSDRD